MGVCLYIREDLLAAIGYVYVQWVEPSPSHAGES